MESLSNGYKTNVYERIIRDERVSHLAGFIKGLTAVDSAVFCHRRSMNGPKMVVEPTSLTIVDNRATALIKIPFEIILDQHFTRVTRRFPLPSLTRRLDCLHSTVLYCDSGDVDRSIVGIESQGKTMAAFVATFETENEKFAVVTDDGKTLMGNKPVYMTELRTSEELKQGGHSTCSIVELDGSVSYGFERMGTNWRRLKGIISQGKGQSFHTQINYQYPPFPHNFKTMRLLAGLPLHIAPEDIVKIGANTVKEILGIKL